MTLRYTRQETFDSNLDVVNMWGGDSTSTLLDDTVAMIRRLCEETHLIQPGAMIPEDATFVIAYSQTAGDVGIGPAFPFNPDSLANQAAQE